MFLVQCVLLRTFLCLLCLEISVGNGARCFARLDCYEADNSLYNGGKLGDRAP